jgi:hypothetical protein
MKRVPALLAAVLCLGALAAAPASAREPEFPVFSTPGRNFDQSPSSVPGGRPFELIDILATNQTPTLEGIVGPAANLRALSVELPPGIVANAASFPRCSQEAFAAAACPTLTQIGVEEPELNVALPGTVVPVFNLAPPPGHPAQFAFRALGGAIHVDFRVRGGSDYGATATVGGIGESAGLLGSTLRIWGVPGDPGHDALRFTGDGTPAPGPYPEAPPFRPLLSNPTSCDGPLITTMEATTWQEPGRAIAAAPFEAPGMGECDQLEFGPRVEVKPTTNLADSPTGLDFHLTIPQNQDPEGSASGQLRSARVVLPAGLAVNPAAAGGLGACSPGQIGLLAPANARQLLRYDLPPVNFSGTFTVSYGGHTTTPIPATASRAAVAAALETLPGLAGNVAVSGAKGGWVVTFTGALAGSAVPLLGGTVTDNPSQTLAVTGEGGSYELEFGGVSGGSLPFNASAAEIQAALRRIPGLGLGNVYPGNVFVGAAGSEEDTRFFRLSFAGDLAGARPALTANSSLTGVGAGVTFTQNAPPAPRSLSVAAFGGDAPGTPQFTAAPAGCPDASKIGTVRVDSPALVDHPLSGGLYLATPGQNPFGSLLAVYLTLSDPATGIEVKLPGRFDTDPAGRLVATFAEAPQLPFEELGVELLKGAAAPLKTALACGTYTVETQLTPWGAPETATLRPKDTFAVTGEAGGGACPASAASTADGSRLEAGTLDPTAGAYSPFVLKLSRPDGSRLLSGVDATLPPGLLARIAGVPTCPDAALAAAAARSGGAEQAAPSCPAPSRVGSVEIAAGAGPSPYNLLGAAYLSGPYRGAPLSLAILAPALAGPFDLGTVVVRVALYVDPVSTRVHAVSDAFPTSLQGIPLDLRSVALRLDAPGFTRNPTSCNPLSFSGAQPVRFQVGDCGRLAFKPKLEPTLKGALNKGAHPGLKVTLGFPAKGNGAAAAAAVITLPKALRFDPTHWKGSCPAQVAAGACPAASAYGAATAATPLLGAPISGPVYLRVPARPVNVRAPKGRPLPEVLVDLRGAVEVVLTGHLETTKAGAVRVNFEDLPDAPISRFTLEMAGGKKGLFRAAAALCSRTSRFTAILDGQNGASTEQSVAPGGSCKKAKAKVKGRRGRGGAG